MTEGASETITLLNKKDASGVHWDYDDASGIFP